MTTPALSVDNAGKFELVPIGNIVPSKTNPRTHFNEEYLQQLAASIAEKGIVEPLIVRPHGAKFEIIAGECRYRSSKLASQTHLPCIIRKLNDEQALEIQIIENLHRKDLTPLEEASGFRALIKSNPDKHSAATIAVRVGKSPSWVWDIMKLEDLIPAAKQLLDEGRMSVNHAIPIARLKPEQQKKVIDPDDGGLFVDETRLHFNEDDDEKARKDQYHEKKSVTVRELNTWINDHIRFDPAHAAKAAPLEFETVAETVETAAAQPGRGKKVISITRDYQLTDSARTDKERTYTNVSWRRADGTKNTTESGSKGWKDSPTCDYSVLGVVVVGPGQGEAFQVCIARDRCQIHWGEEIKAREKNRKQREGGSKTSATANKKPQWQIDQERREAEHQRREQRWKTFGPALRKATYGKLETLKNAVPKNLFVHLLKARRLPLNTKPADLAVALVRRSINDSFQGSGSWNEPEMTAWAKALGVNVKALEPKKERVQTAGVKRTAKKRAAKKR